MIDDFTPAKAPKPIKLDLPLEVTGQKVAKQSVSADAVRPQPQGSAFKTPEEIAVSALMGEPPQEETIAEQVPIQKQKKRFSLADLLAKFNGFNKKQKAIVIVVIVLVLSGIGGGAYALTRPGPEKAVATVKPIKKAPAIVKPTVSPLTGLVATKTQTQLPITAVMIENSADARPQSGLKDAGVVFEAIAEAGITRFMAVYQEAEPGNIGPVRSSRPYYLRWALPFQASYAHVGGSPDALADIKTLGIRDLDQFYNSDAYHRISSRQAPHNVYTSIASLRTVEQTKGYMSSNFTGFVRKADKPVKAPTASSIDFSLSSAFYSVHYDYDAAANSYKRSEGGAPHMDADSNTQLEPHVVAALIMPYSLMSDGYHSEYNTIGSGKMYVFQDGSVTTGSWAKDNDSAQFIFKDDVGKVLALDPGQTWITALGDASNVTYK